jgi:hypothetical protein
MLVLSSDYPGAGAASADKSHMITAKLQSGPRSLACALGVLCSSVDGDWTVVAGYSSRATEYSRHPLAPWEKPGVWRP